MLKFDGAPIIVSNEAPEGIPIPMAWVLELVEGKPPFTCRYCGHDLQLEDNCPSCGGPVERVEI